MKKILLMAAFAVATLSANAQSYVGGTLGFSTSKDKTAGEKTTTSFVVAPEIGTSLNDKWGIGIALGVGYNKQKLEHAGVSAETNSTIINVSPYARYQAIKWGRANIFVDGGILFGMEKAKDMKAALDLGLFVTPGVAFNLNEKWSIVAKANNLFTLGFHKDAVADVSGAPDAPTSFKAGINTLESFTLGSLTFGVYYNF